MKCTQFQAFRRDFKVLQIKKEDTINDYFGRLMGIINKIRIYGDKLEDEIVVKKILRSLNHGLTMMFVL